jgi:peroxiredoxin (alkyl hydroperoxide reductase subunit C)
MSKHKEHECDCQEEKNEVVGLPRLNEPAPYFEAVTTHGVKKLSDYKGQWLVLFCYSL